MANFSLLIGYFDKQLPVLQKLHREIVEVDLSGYEEKFLFSMRVQQLYTAIEDLFKQIAKAFENHIDNLSAFHKEVLLRMSLDIPKMRPAVISNESAVFLDKLRSFRHFVRHAYDCELDEAQLRLLQTRLRDEFSYVEKDLAQFLVYVRSIA